MRTSKRHFTAVPPSGRGAERTEFMYQVFGVLLLAVGSALVYDESSKTRTALGAGLGLLLLLAGSSLALDLPPEASDAP